MKNEQIIARLPYILSYCLITNAYFDDIVVVVAEKGNLARQIEQAQALISEKQGKRGIAVIVLQVVGDDMSNTLQFGPMNFYPAFQVIENVELNHDDNGTRKPALAVARKIRDVIKTFNFIGVIQDMRTAKPCILPEDMSELGASTVSYSVHFQCVETGLTQMTAVQLPQIFYTPTQFNLACPTAGAEIWYTLDETFPFNGTADDYPEANGTGKPSTAQLFVAGQPVNIPPGGCYLTCRAYLDGDNYIASGVQRGFLVNNS
jgi:hypothetical protein